MVHKQKEACSGIIKDLGSIKIKYNLNTVVTAVKVIVSVQIRMLSIKLSSANTTMMFTWTFSDLSLLLYYNNNKLWENVSYFLKIKSHCKKNKNIFDI